MVAEENNSVKSLEVTLTLRNNRLKKERLKMNLTQKEVAEKIGIPYGAYNKAECLGHVKNKYKDLISIYYKLSDEYLFPEETNIVNNKIVREVSKDDLSIGYKEKCLELEYSNKLNEKYSGMRELIENAMSSLYERESLILKLRYGFHDGTPWTLKKIGIKLNISSSMVREIEQRALRKMRHLSRSRGIGDALQEEGLCGRSWLDDEKLYKRDQEFRRFLKTGKS